MQSLRFLDLVIAHLLSYPPSLHPFMLPGFKATMRALTTIDVIGSVHRFRSNRGDARWLAWALIFQLPVWRWFRTFQPVRVDSSPCLSRLNFRPFRL